MQVFVSYRRHSDFLRTYLVTRQIEVATARVGPEELRPACRRPRRMHW